MEDAHSAAVAAREARVSAIVAALEEKHAFALEEARANADAAEPGRQPGRQPFERPRVGLARGRAAVSGDVARRCFAREAGTPGHDDDATTR